MGVPVDLFNVANAVDALSSTEAGYIDNVTAGTAAASKAVVLDASKGVTTITSATITTLTSTTLAASSGPLDVSSIIKPTAGSGADAANAVIMGVGTSGDPSLTSTADKSFLEFRCKTTATSGDNRLFYARFEQNGINATGGECVRAFSKITAAIGTARGAHISLDLGTAAGSISGLGVGVDSQLLIGDAAETTGTLFALQGEVYMEGTSSDLPASHAIVSVKANGNATGVANVLNAMAFAGSAGSGKMIYDNNSTGAAESNGSIRILVDEGSGYVARYLRYWDAQNS